VAVAVDLHQVHRHQWHQPTCYSKLAYLLMASAHQSQTQL